jgi:hypothetical protein
MLLLSSSSPARGGSFLLRSIFFFILTHSAAAAAATTVRSFLFLQRACACDGSLLFKEERERESKRSRACNTLFLCVCEIFSLGRRPTKKMQKFAQFFCQKNTQQHKQQEKRQKKICLSVGSFFLGRFGPKERSPLRRRG